MPEIARNHHVGDTWNQVMARIRAEIGARHVEACATVVVLPYAQLMPIARDAWVRSQDASAGAAFMPRFETTSNWSQSRGGFWPAPHDMHLDAARDLLSAASLLHKAGMGRQSRTLAGRLMESAWELARVAAAVLPAQRAEWGRRMVAAMGPLDTESETRIEGSLALIAIAWAASSAYATDNILQARPALLVLVQGFQPEPLYATLREQSGDRCILMQLDHAAPAGAIALHKALDAEDEAERASACVLHHLARGRVPVALVAQDRFLMRRMRALLGERGVVVRDETGWTLSTTRAAATVMATVRACAWDASGDTVLDWLKNAPAFDAVEVSELETRMRLAGMREWRDVPAVDGLAARVQELRSLMQAARPVAAWLAALRDVLQQAGQWEPLLSDSAGQAVVSALRLPADAALNLDDFGERLAPALFATWLGQTLEQGSFVPPHPSGEQVVILPLTQLLGRNPAAVVFPGCDEDRFPASPDLTGLWSATQRAVLGLTTRDALARAARAAWHTALRFDHVDILWRSSHGGEARMPGLLVQEFLLDHPEMADDPRVRRVVQARAGRMPQPRAAALAPVTLSSSAYEDLRSCPYKFFALRQLRLRDQDELEAGLDKRDFGLWLHAVLRHFHESLAAAPVADPQQRRQLLNAAAQTVTEQLGLSPAEFLPYSAAWPRTCANYLQWLSAHEDTGAVFVGAEVDRRVGVGPLQLVGRLDRLDRAADGTALVLDYKTEQRDKTANRVKPGNDDTQLAFYAALLPDDTLDAAYLSVSETSPVGSFRHADVVALRDVLLGAIRDDVQRIADGAVLPALGSGTACEYCAARGLCRRDFWEQADLAGASASHG